MPAPKHATSDNVVDILRLFRSEGIGPITFYKLVEFYGTATKAIAALPEMAKRGGRKKPLVATDEKSVEGEVKALHKLGGCFLTYDDPRYPQHLRACEDAPPVIATLGNIELLAKQGLAIVGGRNASINGLKLAEVFAREISEAGFPIVSGFARGIDTAAHKASLQHGTIGVFAGGIDVIYPESNKDLYTEMIKHGCIVAESPLGVQPQRHYFPKRNRIIAGLTHGTVVVEAKQKSGSLITANMALDYGRDVYAVPGSPLDPRAAGGNHLIQSGAAKLVSQTGDILEDLNKAHFSPLRENDRSDLFSSAPKPMADTLDNTAEAERDEARKAIENALSATPVHIDELIRATGIKPALVHVTLLELELGGKVQRHPGGLINLIL